MRATRWAAVAAVAAMWAWACGGTSSVSISNDGGAEGGSGSGSTSGSGGSSGSSSGGSSGSSSGGSSGSGSGSGSSSGSGHDGGSGHDSGSGHDGGSGNDGGSGFDGGSGNDGGTTVCPAHPPKAGDTCPIIGLECEYGTNPNPTCNVIASCSTTGWGIQSAGGCSGTCPASYSDVPQGQTCSPEGLDCAYSQGQCNCSRTFPVGGPTPVWQCTTPMAGCPEPRAPLGSPCSQEGLSCNYGGCSGGVAEQCTGGYWRRELLPCPG
jgi:hypothetical protein